MTILHKMREKKLLPEDSITEILGKQGEQIEDTFMRVDSLLREKEF